MTPALATRPIEHDPGPLSCSQCRCLGVEPVREAHMTYDGGDEHYGERAPVSARLLGDRCRAPLREPPPTGREVLRPSDALVTKQRFPTQRFDLPLCGGAEATKRGSKAPDTLVLERLHVS